MRKSQKIKRRKKSGLVPGSVVFNGNKKVDKVFVHYLRFDEKKLTDNVFHNHDEIIFHHSNEEEVDWYDIRGLHDIQLIELLGKTFDIHPLILEDVADTYQRPKFEEYNAGIFITIRALSFDKESRTIKTEHVAIYFRKGLIISFQENETDLFEQVRNRIQSDRGRVRQRGADYLTYALVDNIVDQYYSVLDKIEEVIEELEDKLMADPDKSIKEQIHHLKKEMITIRRSITPLREAISLFAKSDNPIIQERTAIFVRDIYDNTVQVMDVVDTYRDMLNSLQDLYLSEISFRMNQVMQVLAVVTTIFVPISFLAGLYGMNFENIPELQAKNGYFILLAVMLTIVLSLLYYFKRKKWF